MIGADNVVYIWDLPIRHPWAHILSLAAIPPAVLALLVLAVRRVRRHRAAAA